MALPDVVVTVSDPNCLLEQGWDVVNTVNEEDTLRLHPVLMTATVASLALTLLLLAKEIGSEAQKPLATDVIGGLVTSPLLTLVVLPVIYDRIAEWAEKRWGTHGGRAVHWAAKAAR